MSQATYGNTTNLSRRSARALRIRLVNERSRSPEPLPALLPQEATGHSGLDTRAAGEGGVTAPSVPPDADGAVIKPRRHKKQDQPKLDPLSVTVRQASAVTGLSHVTIYKLIGEGKLHSVKIGRRRLITYASLRGLLEAAAH
jgi:excisionase family DNA binding protein